MRAKNVLSHDSKCSGWDSNPVPLEYFSGASSLWQPASSCYAGSCLSNLNADIFWDIAPCSPYVNRRFGGKYPLHLQGKNQPSKKLSSSRSENVRTTRRCNPEDGNSIDLSLSSEGTSSAAIQDIPITHCLIYKSPPRVLMLSQINPVLTITSYLSKRHIIIIIINTQSSTT
jgi:hypothetical protein